MNIVQSLEKSLKTGCCKRPTTLVLSFSLKRSKFNEQSYIISCCKKLVLASSSCGKLQFLALPQWFHALRMYPTLHPLQQAWETCQRPTVFVDLYYCTLKSLLIKMLSRDLNLDAVWYLRLSWLMRNGEAKTVQTSFAEATSQKFYVSLWLLGEHCSVCHSPDQLLLDWSACLAALKFSL